MDRVRRKKTNRDESDLFSNIPVDLLIEIFLKLPAKSIANLIFVSKHWSSVIRDKGFTELYLTRSFTRPRLLFSVYRPDMQFFQSGSLEDPSSDHYRVTITSSSRYRLCPPIRGLICCHNGTKVLIGNSSTGQFVTLPKVKTRKRRFILSFFGYDPVNDLYKVLCMTVLYVPLRGKFAIIGTKEHQVFTLGAKQKWRMIECKHRHCPAYFESKGICSNGFVYYLASINDEVSQSLISFNLTSEAFNVIKLPENVKHLWSCNLVNYGGQIALENHSCDGKLDLWVLNDASKQEWSKASLLVPSCKDLVENQRFKFRGTLSTGELIFVPCSSLKPFFFICYDLKENSSRKVVIEGLGDDFDDISVFLDHVESPMFLPKVIS